MKKRLYILTLTLLTLTNINLSATAFNGGNGSKDQPYSIVNAEQMDAVRAYCGAAGKGVYFCLDADINLTDYNGGFWTPIGGNQEDPFQGKFNGNGKTIRNLRIGKQGNFYQYTGLFGRLSDGAEICNLTLEGGEITGNASATGNVYTGAIAGYISSGKETVLIDSCTNKIPVTGGSSAYPGSSYTGGICGFILTGASGEGAVNISATLNTGDVTGKNATGAYTGGICGQALAASSALPGQASINILYCMNIGTVTGGTAYSSVSATGGISGYYSAFGSGYPDQQGTGNTTISHCINSGIVSGGEKSGLSDSYTGGITGYQLAGGNLYGNADADITYCINNGQIFGNDTEENTYNGGISGHIASYATTSGSSIQAITNSYNYAPVTSVSQNNATGAIAGKVTKSDMQDANLQFSTNYWFAGDDHYIQVIGIEENIQINHSDIVSLNAEQFQQQNSFSNWTFGETPQAPWKIREGNTPPYLYIQGAPIQIISENENELLCSFVPGTTIGNITVYRKSGIQYKELRTIKNPAATPDGTFTVDISGASNGSTLRIISFEQGKMPSNPAYIVVTKSTTSQSTGVQHEIASVYPNPVIRGGEIHITTGIQTKKLKNRLNLLDMSGKLIQSHTFTGADTYIHVPTTTGIYILQHITQTGEKRHSKIIVQ